MATFRSFSEIVSTMIQRLNLTQPNLDTKPGAVSRDLFVDLPADQIAKLYSAVGVVAEKQSLATTSGRDLQRLASNFGASRNPGSSASGIVIFCTNNLVADISIPTGTTVTARNGVKFRTIGNFVMSAANKNRFAANADRMRKGLNIAGINSQYALEVPVQAMRTGTGGNVGSLQIVSLDAPISASVINLTAMTGGASGETDDSFRSRILSVFSGANIGTSAGYRNSLLGVPGVMDAIIVEPGNVLMLRDGTETLETGDGSERIISSGTGGKVDAYILGRKISAITESFVFTDLSGSGNISDDRNDYILGQVGQDPTRTSEERRVLSFKTGSMPSQPVDSMISVVGSSSGALVEAFTDSNGITYGNFKLEKDLNPETGGSPFGFDKMRFISNVKRVVGEGITKAGSFSIDPLAFSEIDDIDGVYRDVDEVGENSEVSTAGKEFIKLLHTPAIRVSKVQNKTTGELYVVADQNQDSTGLNTSGIVEISGRSLPTSADILSVNYTWRQEYDKHIDYGGSSSLTQFRDPSASDAVDWTPSGGIFKEESVISKSEDGLSYEIEMDYNINKVVSVFKQTELVGTVATVTSIGSVDVAGIEIDSEEDIIDDIISIRRVSDNLEIYNTAEADGSFSARTVYLPTDSLGNVDDEVVIFYNKIELFDLEKSDGSSYNNVISLPSEGVLEAENALSAVEDLYLSGDYVYATYVADINLIYPKTTLSSLPITGGESSNSLAGSEAFSTGSSNQPIFFEFDELIAPYGITRFGPTQIEVGVSGVSKPGKIKVAGTTLNRYILELTAGTALRGLTFNVESELKEALGLSSIPDTVGIAKIDEVFLLNSDGDVDERYDVHGASVADATYSLGSAQVDSDLRNYEFTLASVLKNKEISTSASDSILVSVLVFNSDDYEELYYEASGSRTTNGRFGRIDRVSVSSGFRSLSGNLVGNLELRPLSQPGNGNTYYVDYNFLAPKEGERITVSYNVNKLITEASAEIERVRPVTADVLVKEAEELLVDVEGTLLINDDALSEAGKIVENVTNTVSNLLSTSKLGPVVDYSDIVAAAASESGVDSVNISLFNESEKGGRKAFVRALDNQTISPGSISFEAVSRNKFRIN